MNKEKLLSEISKLLDKHNEVKHPEHDEFGFMPGGTEHGGLWNKFYNDFIDECQVSEDPLWRKAVEGVGRFIVVNKNLTPEQQRLFRYNYRRMSHVLRTPTCVQRMQSPDTQSGYVDNHMVAILGNYTYPDDEDEYRIYMSAIVYGAKNYIKAKYKRLKSSGVPR